MQRLVLGFVSVLVSSTSLSSCAGNNQVSAPAGARPPREDMPEFRHFPVQLRRQQGAAAERSGPSPERSSLDAATDADLKFLANARHAVELYREFLKRAAGDDSYAEAVAEANERIDELEQTIAFVEAGMRERAAR
jgi:hypothetical protein